MANVGPPGGAKDAVKLTDTVADAFNKNANPAMEDTASKATNLANTLKKVSDQMKKLKTLSPRLMAQRTSALIAENKFKIDSAIKHLKKKIKEISKYEKDFSDLLRQESEQKSKFEKDFANLLRKEEESNEKKYIRDITAMLREEHNEKMRLEREFNREFRELLRKEAEDNLKAVRESRKKEKESRNWFTLNLSSKILEQSNWLARSC